MSIIGQAAAPENSIDIAGLAILIVYGAIAIALAIAARIFKRRSVEGPARLAPGESLGVYLSSMLIGFTLWITLPVLILGNPAKPIPPVTTGPSMKSATSLGSTPPAYPPDKLAIASLAGGITAFAAMLIVLHVLRNAAGKPPENTGLGLRPACIRTGIWRGAIGAFMMTWLVLVATILTEFIWRKINYTHAKEHDLLRMLGESKSPAMSALLISSAALVAPLFEETLFRGHLQTLLSYTFARWFNATVPQDPSATPQVFAPLLPGDSSPTRPAILTYATPTPRKSAGPPSAPARWAAIIITSALFALVHPAWTIPPIFILSLCVGYAYERTANLWLVITMHALFNATSLVFFLTTH